MRIVSIDSFDGNSFSSNNITGTLAEDTPLTPSVTPIWVSRSGAWPILAGKEFQGQVINLQVTCNVNPNTTLESLIKWFAPSDETPRQLIVSDENGVQWYKYVSCFQMSAQDNGFVMVSVACDDPVWQSYIQHSQSWLITATGQSTDISVLGNQPSWPLFEITPTSYPAAGYIYNTFIQLYPTSANPWPNRPIEITGGGWNTVALISSTDNFCLVNLGGGISADTDVIPFDTVTGSLPGSGMIYIGTEQITYTSKTGTSAGTFNGCARGVNGTSAVVHADNSPITLSYVAVDGRDIRLYKDGAEIDYWWGTGIRAFNNTGTYMYISADMPTYLPLTVKTALGAGALTEVEFVYSTAQKTSLQGWPAQGRFVIQSEEFTYTSRTITTTKLAVTVNSRGVRNTTAATHAALTTAILLPYDFTIVYGNTGVSAPTIDDTYKPIFDLTSINSSFIYTNFRDIQGLRPGSWASGIISQASARYSKNKIYTATQNTDANPASIAGVGILAFQQAGTWKSETAELAWSGRFTDTVSTVSYSGEAYQTNVSWPATAALQGSTDGTAWATLKNTTTAVSSDYAAWTAFSYAAGTITVPSNINYLRFDFNGTVKSTANNAAYFGPTAITVNMTNTPSITWRTPAAIAVNNFQFAGSLSNLAGQSITFNYPLTVGQTLYIDTDPDFPTAKAYGNIVNGSIRIDAIRPDWLPATTGTETFTFTATAASNIGNVTIVIKWRDRKMFL